MLSRGTEEEKAAKAAVRAEQQADKEARRLADQQARERRDYLTTPVGLAEMAHARGDQVFQYQHDVMSQQAIIVAMLGSATSKTTADPSEILNAVCMQGWEIVSGSFVFIVEGEQSRDKFLASGQNTSVKGRTIGYYLFRRCDANRRVAPPQPQVAYQPPPPPPVGYPPPPS